MHSELPGSGDSRSKNVRDSRLQIKGHIRDACRVVLQEDIQAIALLILICYHIVGY